MTVEPITHTETHLPPMTETGEADRHTVALVWDNAMTDSEPFDTAEKALKLYEASIKQSHILFALVIRHTNEEHTIVASYVSAKLKGN